KRIAGAQRRPVARPFEAGRSVTLVAAQPSGESYIHVCSRQPFQRLYGGLRPRNYVARNKFPSGIPFVLEEKNSGARLRNDRVHKGNEEGRRGRARKIEVPAFRGLALR